MNRKILSLAIPSIISNITVPLLGLVDMGIVGHLGSAAYIGAIAVGTMMFNVIYWIFNFLRMGTGGITSQSYGMRDLKGATHVLVRATCVGSLLSLALILLQLPIEWVTFRFVQCSEEIRHFASLYFRICVWGAPAVLCLYGFNGWFIGMQNTKTPMIVAISQNIINILCSFCFVYLFDMGIKGLAYATLMAQYSGLFMSIYFWNKYYKRLMPYVSLKNSLHKKEIKRFFSINKDIFLRTLCLVSVTTYFTISGAKQGDIVLAVNTLLMQLFTIYSYFMDGFAYAGEALTGKYIGANNRKALNKMLNHLFLWGVGLALCFTLLYGVGGEKFLYLLTDNANVINTSGGYFYRAIAIPIAGFAAFLWDGIFIGATATKFMLYSMLVASVGFFAISILLEPFLGNHALWLSFLCYLFLRGSAETVFYLCVLNKKKVILISQSE